MLQPVATGSCEVSLSNREGRDGFVAQCLQVVVAEAMPSACPLVVGVEEVEEGSCLVRSGAAEEVGCLFEGCDDVLLSLHHDQEAEDKNQSKRCPEHNHSKPVLNVVDTKVVPVDQAGLDRLFDFQPFVFEFRGLGFL